MKIVIPAQTATHLPASPLIWKAMRTMCFTQRQRVGAPPQPNDPVNPDLLRATGVLKFTP